MVEVVRERVGFRRFEMKNGVMCLNGQRIVLKGVTGTISVPKQAVPYGGIPSAATCSP